MRGNGWEEFRDSYGTMQSFLERGYLNSGSPVPSNIQPLDSLLCGGFRPGLHVLGGEPGSGKSAFGLFVSMMSALSGARAMYISLEMSRSQCMSRCLSFASTTTGHPFEWGNMWELARRARGQRDEALRRGDAAGFAREFNETDPVALAASSLESRCPGLLIADSQSLHEISGIESALRRGRECGLDIAVVDYLQYVGEEGTASEYDRVSSVSKRLNMLSVELSVPILALASCSRAGNKTKETPDMHAFKGSGDIEYHALSAMVIDRDPEGSDLDRRLHVVKNRFGGVTDSETCIRLRFDGAHNSFALAV